MRAMSRHPCRHRAFRDRSSHETLTQKQKTKIMKSSRIALFTLVLAALAAVGYSASGAKADPQGTEAGCDSGCCPACAACCSK